MHSIRWGSLLDSGQSEDQGDMGDDYCILLNIPAFISCMDVEESIELTALYVVLKKILLIILQVCYLILIILGISL